MIGHYDWPGGREAFLRFGPGTGPVVVVAMPFLEEANRTRAFAATMARLLAARGIGTVIPDLPGQGESVTPLETVRLADLRSAFACAATAAGALPHIVSLRSGALLTHEARAASRWSLAPVTGATLARDWNRIRHLSAPKSPAPAAAMASEPVWIAGNPLRQDLLDDLAAATPDSQAPIRTAALQTDSAPADLHVPGSALWRRAEPDNDPALAALLAGDIAAWIATCGG